MAFQIPLLLALGLTGAGMGANMIGARKTDKAQANVMAANRIRHEGLDDEAFAINRGAQDRYRDIEGQQETRSADLTEMLTARPEGEEPKLGLPPTDSNITVQHGEKKQAEAKDFTDQQGAAKARLMSLGDLFGDMDRGFARDAVDLGGIQGFKRGWMGVMPTELDAAAQEGSGWRTAGDVLGGLGTVATMGALSGASVPGMGGLSRLFGGAAPMAGTNMLQQAKPASPLVSLFGRG